MAAPAVRPRNSPQCSSTASAASKPSVMQQNAQERRLTFGPQLERLGLGELRNPLKYSPGHFALRRVRIFVNIFPAGRLVGPDQQPETLDQSVATRAIRICAADVFGNLRRLGVAKHPNADSLEHERDRG